jgi:hypothetical protein
MRPNLRRIEIATGKILAGGALPDAHHKVSLRHMDAAPDGTVLVGGQDEGPAGGDAPLVFLWPMGGDSPRILELPIPDLRRLDRYVGSVAVDRTGRLGATASPRGGRVLLFDLARGGALVDALSLADACGLVRDVTRDGTFFVSNGMGRLYRLSVAPTGRAVMESIAGPRPSAAMWDNHLATRPA